MQQLNTNELLVLLQELQWILRIKYKIDYKEIYKTIIERFQEDIIHENISFDIKRNRKQEKENIIHFIENL